MTSRTRKRMMSARRVETLQGYGDNDKWTLSELLLDIEKKLLMKHKFDVHIMRTRLTKVRRWMHPNTNGCNVKSVRNGGECLPGSLPTTYGMSGIAA